VEANLLDMVVFIELHRLVYKKYWLPEVFGPLGQPMVEVFDRASKDIWALASTVLDETQKERLASVISRWREAHPNQVYVDMVRLSQFSYAAGDEALRRDAEGLLAQVGHAAAATDELRMLGERFLYYAQRAPFIMRAQASVATSEVIDQIASASSRINAAKIAQLAEPLGDLGEREFNLAIRKAGLVGAALLGLAFILALALLLVSHRLAQADRKA
jgi:hypothetical protein